MSTIRTGDDLELNSYEWCADEPKAVVALVHGYGEHAGRYAHVGAAWNAKGISVIAADLRGHGASPGVRGHCERFSDYHLDARAIYERATEVAAGAPVFLMGHSMGGLTVLDWLLSGGQPQVRGVVLSSPFLGVALEVNPVKAFAGKVMSRLLPTFALPTGLAGDLVTRDPEILKLYDTDPLNNTNATARWYTEAMDAIERVHARAQNLTVPLILLYAGDDKAASADATDRVAAKLAMPERTVERLSGLYHELVNEPPDVRGPIIERYASWMLERAS